MLGSISRVGPVFGHPRWDPLFGSYEVPEVCDPCDKIDELTVVINTNNTDITTILNNILACCQTSENKIKILQSDVDEVKKRTKYWEDRNLLRQTPDEKAGRSDFRRRRQDLGGKS